MHPDSDLLSRYKRIRNFTEELSTPLSTEDCCAQSMPDASPMKWHLAHTTWFFETFLLEKFEKEYRPFHPEFRYLFNSYYNGIGDKHPRPQRGLLTRPSLEVIFAYRKQVDQRVREIYELEKSNPEFLKILELGLNHEQQHQELALTDILHLFSSNPLLPSYRECKKSFGSRTEKLNWIRFDSALTEIGHDGDTFCFDNETPKHRSYLESFHLASRLVTNNEYLGFIEAGGYQRPEYWLAEGWDWIRSQEIQQPLYWHRSEKGWMEFSLDGLRPLVPHRSLSQISYFEADAFARWSGARLPTEFEWEHAARLAESQPAIGFSDFFGTAWQWTSSSYAPYPGFHSDPGTIGEYNGKFMVNQYVLRGSSQATPEGHSRLTYRNFFPATARWQFTGIRLAKSS